MGGNKHLLRGAQGQHALREIQVCIRLKTIKPQGEDEVVACGHSDLSPLDTVEEFQRLERYQGLEQLRNVERYGD